MGRSFGLKPQWGPGNCDGLDVTELQQAVDRYEAIYESVRRWQKDRAGRVPEAALSSGFGIPSNRVHMYWTDRPSPGMEFPRFSVLPNLDQVGILTAAVVGYDVWLWTHSDKVEGVPEHPGIRIMPACSMVAASEALHALHHKKWEMC